MPSEIRQIIENSQLFSGLDPGLIEDIAASATKKTLGAHEVLFQKGDRADALWGVLSGRIVIEVRADDGKEMVLDEFLVGDVFGEVGVLDFGPRRVEATAACKSELFRLERSHFIEHLQTNPELCFRIFSLLCGHLRDTTETLEDTALYKLPSRLAKRLLLMSHTTASDDGCAELNVVQSDLARMMGVHREAVNRQLRAWEKSGWISLQRQRIKILEEKSLADFAAPSQSVDPRSWGNDNLSRMLPTAFPTQHEAKKIPAQPEKRFAGVLAVSCAEYAVMLKTDSANAIKRIKTGLAAIDKAISDYGGRLIWSAGERSLAEFSDGASAMEAALEIQKTAGLVGPDAEQTSPVFRMGIHSGEVLASDGQFIGEPVNIAIRLTELSGSGGICFTRQVRDELEESRSLQLQYLGKHELKNVANPVSVYSARSIPWLKRIVLWANTLLPRRYRPSLVLALVVIAVISTWLGGQRFGESLAPGPPTQSIAVLPFATGGDTTLEYLAQSIPEEVRSSLSTIPVVRVIGRESSNYYSERPANAESVAQMGEELNVTHVLDGRVHKVGNQLNITARLIKADDGSQLWSKTFDRSPDDVFGIQNEITAAVIDEFKVNLLGAMPTKKAADPEAYVLYLKGRLFENLGGRDNSLKAFSAYQQALAIDPEYALAWVGVSWHYSYFFSNGFIPREEGYVLALEALENALAADNNLALAWSSRGHFKMKYDWDWEGARADIDMALQLDPNLPETIGSAASLALIFGQYATSLRLRERKADLDPLHLTSLSALGQTYLRHKQPDKALEIFERILEINSDFPWIYEKLGRAYLLQGDAARALIEFNKYPTIYDNVLNKARAHATLGNESEAQAVVNEYLATSSQEYPFWTAAVFARQGDNDKVFEWLEIAFQQRDPGLRYILTNVDRRKLQNDPRYPVFLKKMGLLEAWKAMPPE